MIHPRKIVLGSASPRRRELLKGLNVEFEIRLKETDEVYPDFIAVEKVPSYLAELKANALLEDAHNDELIITSDTVVILDNVILGKPENREMAISMLQQLSGKTHRVITAVSFSSLDQQETIADTTWVTFKTLSLAEIEFYVDNYQPYDKAGSYGVQEWIGYVAVEKMEGSYTTVMGFPTHLVYDYLKKNAYL